MINRMIMETYTHFGKQPDVLKHLVLCEVLQIEKPQIYVETNSACAIYTMTHTPEQEYGIYHFLTEANKDATLKNSLYYQYQDCQILPQVVLLTLSWFFYDFYEIQQYRLY